MPHWGIYLFAVEMTQLFFFVTGQRMVTSTVYIRAVLSFVHMATAHPQVPKLFPTVQPSSFSMLVKYSPSDNSHDKL